MTPRPPSIPANHNGSLQALYFVCPSHNHCETVTLSCPCLSLFPLGQSYSGAVNGDDGVMLVISITSFSNQFPTEGSLKSSIKNVW